MTLQNYSLSNVGRGETGMMMLTENKDLSTEAEPVGAVQRFQFGGSSLARTPDEELLFQNRLIQSGKIVKDGVIEPAGGLRTVEQAGISPSDAARIQNAANRTGQEIAVVGSRANGTATPMSDWDYIMSGNSAQRHSAASSLPRGTAGGEINSMGRETGIDIFTNYPNSPKFQPLDLTRPYVLFPPKK